MAKVSYAPKIMSIMIALIFVRFIMYTCSPKISYIIKSIIVHRIHYGFFMLFFLWEDRNTAYTKLVADPDPLHLYLKWRVSS